MIVTREDELTALRRRVNELELEIAEWRRQAADRALTVAQADRVARLRQALVLSAAPARMLEALLARAPKMVSKAALFEAAGSDPDRTALAVVDVQVCRIRAALERRGLPGAIETIWGAGYAIPADQALAIREGLGL